MAFAAFTLAVAECGAEECVVLRPGEVDIVVEKNAPPAVQFAADEL